MGFPNISHDGLKKAIANKKITLLDCNGSEQFANGHIPGAIDFEAEQGRLSQVLPSDKNALIVAYCGGEGCMAFTSGAKAAADLGYKKVKHYALGIKGWIAAGERVDSLAGAAKGKP